jgi:hypothetical protein
MDIGQTSLHDMTNQPKSIASLGIGNASKVPREEWVNQHVAHTAGATTRPGRNSAMVTPRPRVWNRRERPAFRHQKCLGRARCECDAAERGEPWSLKATRWPGSRRERGRVAAQPARRLLAGIPTRPEARTFGGGMALPGLVEYAGPSTHSCSPQRGRRTSGGAPGSSRRHPRSR